VPAGRVIGRFLAGPEIGRGGHGIVYEGSDLWLERPVALKTIVPREAGGEVTTARREARLLARVADPHVVGLFDFISLPEADVLVMELVTGPSLHVLAPGSALLSGRVEALGAQLADGLRALHDAGVVHGDIKPANLRLSARGVLKILDLGVAHSTNGGALSGEAPTGSRMIAGTIPYMSPEQLQGCEPDVRSDIWSAGAVLFELATGQRAVDTMTPASQLRFIREGLFPSPREIRPNISGPLADVIVRAMAPDPLQRFQSARELLRALGSCAATVESPPPDLFGARCKS
jgi:serine/threonine protein kinase